MKRKFPFAVGSIHHIYNRGVAKCKICIDDVDYWRFLQGLCLFNDTKSANHILWQLERDRGALNLKVLKKYIVDPANERSKLVRILAYCVMDNHYHLLVEEIREGGITKFMQKLGVGYVNYFNKKHERVGSLFQNKFQNVPVESEQHLMYLLVYINVLNPAQYLEPHWKDGGIKNPKAILAYVENYLWSTHQEYLGKRNSIIIEKGVLGEIFPTPDAYRALIRTVIEAKKYEEVTYLMLE
ncbi:MAG: hypothetical protein A3D64_01055 [Candidatus Wildermuthbacteria bacterium RIFCSPHIGHO2_02_FULL_49_9]|uniref:Transposase IS200-like domain-containing protein n=1 Tax=Candidatus Wildermuthbacteria bacterium RIFCSPHIGHO2_02_FULL_49_9 TaxID=1802456 RepID=A0A1G2RF54_9BACT|nr:MAG: hypothetical protein A3D64_01055 [Candidatus Wildermuthbacteria bacterium RIFCSPHIGHO2_02_FULL_49_9]